MDKVKINLIIFNKIKTFALIFVLSLGLASCKNSEEFGFLNDSTSDDLTIEEQPVEIRSFLPTSNPVRVTDTTTTTFVVTVNPDAGSALVYTWKLNGATLQSGPESYLLFNGTSAGAGSNNLQVEVSNSISSDSKIFNVEKNTAPIIGATTPAGGGNVVSCGLGGTLQFTAAATDVDGDPLTFAWKLDGSSNSTYFSALFGPTNTTMDFTPSSCALVQDLPHTVSVEVSDGYETNSYSWSVVITDPTVASIDTYSPTGSPIVIPSTGSQVFSVSYTAKDPNVFKWQLNGADIPGETNAIINLSAASLAIGTHTLTALITDSDSSDSHDFIVKRNAPPVIANESPISSLTKLNYQSFTTFSIDASDANGDTMTYTWTLDDLPSAYLGTSPTAGGSQAIFSPDVSVLGAHTVKVHVSDGTESATYSWTVEVNFFTDACNQMGVGQICTLVGAAGLGSDIDPVTNPQVAKVRPYAIENDGNDNLFIADGAQDVVWFYNRSGADITILGQTIGAGKVKVIAGRGAYGSSGDLVPATEYRFRDPQGVAWDPNRQELYVSNYNDRRIVRITSAGVARHDLCSGSNANDAARHPDGGPALNHACDRPNGLAFDAINNRLYVANTDDDNIKYFDVSDPDPANWTGHMVVCRPNGGGACTEGTGDGVTFPTGGTKSQLKDPWGLKLDNNGLLHISETKGCYVRVANLSGAAVSFYGGDLTIANNEVKRVAGSNNCNSNSNQLYNAMRFRQPRDVQPYYSGATYYGWFVTSYDHDRVVFVNATAGDLTIGNRTFTAKKGHYVWGNGSAGYSGESKPAMSNLVNVPWGLSMNAAGTKLILADRDNYRIRTLDVSVANGDLESWLSGKEKADFSGGSNTPAPQVLMSSPRGLGYDPVNKKMLYQDWTNGRLRSIDLVTGEENVEVSQGSNNISAEQEDPSDVWMRGPRDVIAFNGGYVFSEGSDGAGVNRRCDVRVYNKNSTATNFWGTVVNPGKVATIAGNFVLGCQNWQAAYDGAAATSVALYRPHGLTTDGTNLYIANQQVHCILKLDPAGIITRFAGKCNTLGNISTTPFNDEANRFRYPAKILIDPSYPTDGNMFVVDQTDSSTAGRLKYINTRGSAVTIADKTIPANSVGILFTNQGSGYGVAVYGDQICYTSGREGNGHLGQHNVVCYDRTDNLGNASIRIGPANGSTTKAGIQFSQEEEGVNSTSAHLFTPYGLEFDADGNLYISERDGHVIRKVNKWW